MKKVILSSMILCTCIFTMGCGASKTVATNTETTKPVVEAKETKKDDSIKAGMYKIGTDLPAGEYLVIAKSNSYLECTKDSTGAMGSIVFNANITPGSNSYVTLSDGEYFKFTGGVMYPIAKAPSIIPADGLYKPGMYKVGQDIPAGEYKVKLTGSNGYIEINTDSSHNMSTIVSNSAIQTDTYVTVKDGQYLTITGGQIQK